MEEFRREITAMQADNERLDQRLTALELTAANRGKATRSQRGSDERPQLRVVRLTPEGEGPSAQAVSEEPAGDDEPRTVIRAEGDEAPTVRRGGSDEAGQRASEERAAQEYERALDLIKSKRYDPALEVLAGFLVRYPGSPNADNATYWRGECYYAKGDYVRAAEQFAGLVARFPKGNKVPDAMLKLGLSQRSMGEAERAQQTFDKLRREHPNSEASRKIPRE
jgi:tol-pal system protein YbgF